MIKHVDSEQTMRVQNQEWGDGGPHTTKQGFTQLRKSAEWMRKCFAHSKSSLYFCLCKDFQMQSVTQILILTLTIQTNRLTLVHT